MEQDIDVAWNFSRGCLILICWLLSPRLHINFCCRVKIPAFHLYIAVDNAEKTVGYYLHTSSYSAALPKPSSGNAHKTNQWHHCANSTDDTFLQALAHLRKPAVKQF